MALLRSEAGQLCPLAERLLIGRSRVCELRLDAAEVSGEHASLRWEAGAWVLRDLGSRNGTWIGSRRVEPGDVVQLAQGDAINLGGAELWTLIDARPPCALAIDDAGQCVSAVDGLLALPSSDDPQVCVHRLRHGQWVLEHDHRLRELSETTTVDVGGTTWTIMVPDSMEPTVEPSASVMSLSDAQLSLKVSSDQEWVEATLVTSRGAVELGARAHHHVLLQLARVWTAEGHIASERRGWVYHDTLSTELALDPAHVNVLIYRARQQLAKLDFVDAASLIERRVGSGQLRLGVADVRIIET